MKITMVFSDGSRRAARLPFDRADHVVIDDEACPHGCEGSLPLRVRGTAGSMRHDHDTRYADAIALCCGNRVGWIEAKVSTVFGIEEDERVLAGPWRVY